MMTADLLRKKNHVMMKFLNKVDFLNLFPVMFSEGEQVAL